MLLRAGAFSCLPERIVFPVPRISWPGHTVLLMRGVVGWRCCAAPSPLSCCVSRHSLGLLEAFSVGVIHCHLMDLSCSPCFFVALRGARCRSGAVGSSLPMFFAGIVELI